MSTPEGDVKEQINKILKAREPELKRFMPVQNGLGAATLDYHVCYLGQYLMIEAKAPGEKPTPRQKLTLEEYRQAGARTLVIDGSDYSLLEDELNDMALLDEIRKR
jgi:hypothetical protein